MGAWEEEKSTLQGGGYSDQEINDYEQKQRDTLFKGGYSQQEIDTHFGVKQFDPQPVKDHVDQNLKDYAVQNGEKGADGNVVPKPASSFVEALEAGWQMSVTGLLKNGKMPDTVLPEDAGMFYRIAAGVGSIAGDIPAMVAGGIGGGALGAAALTPAAPLFAGAGTFAVPAGMRRILMDHYQKGDVKDAGDFFERAASAFIEAGKGALTGAATTASGGIAGVGAEAIGAGAATTALAKTVSEVATMTTVGKALEGQAPHPQDFLDAAILVGGMHLATGVAGHLRELYAATGMSPAQAALKTETSPALKQELVSTHPDKEVIAELATGLPRETWYHGTKSDIKSFDPEMMGTSTLADSAKKGFFFTDNPTVANQYAELAHEPSFVKMEALTKQMVGVEEQYGIHNSMYMKPDPGTTFHDTAKPLTPENLVAKNPSLSIPEAEDVISKVKALDAEYRVHSKDLNDLPADSRAFSSIYPVHLDMKNPYVHDFGGKSFRDETYSDIISKAKAAGHDGVLLKNTMDNVSDNDNAGNAIPPHNVSVVFDPKQITFKHSQGEEGGPPLEPPKPPSPPTTPPGEPPGPGDGRTNAEKQVDDFMGPKSEKQKQSYSWSKFCTDFVDRLNPVKQVLTELLGKESYDAIARSPSNPLNIMRMVSDAPAKARAFLEKGPFDFTSKAYDKDSKGFFSIVAPFKDDVQGFERYLVSARILEIEGQKDLEGNFKKSGGPLDAAKEVVAQGEGKYGAAASEMTNYQNQVLKYVKDSGRLSDEQYNTLVEAHKSYIPFARIFSPEEMEAGQGGGKGGLGSLKELKGSDRNIENPLQRIKENTLSMIKFAEKNRAMTSLIDLVEKTPDQTLFEKSASDVTVTKAGVSEMQKYLNDNGIDGNATELELFRRQTKTQLADNEFELYRDGKREVWSTDKDTAAAIKSLDGDATSQNLFMTLARGATSTLKIGTTLTPDFIARHLFRNQLISGTYSEIGRVPFTGVLSAMGDIYNKSDAYWEWMKSGGAGGAFLNNGETWFNQNIGKLEESTGFLNSAHNALMAGKEKMEALGTLFENSTRLAEFKRTVGSDTSGEANTKGGIASREITIDYQRMGARMSAWNAITAFQNVSIQSGDRMVRAFQDDPTGTMAKGLGYITAPTLALWWANKDDERIKEIPQWEKDMFWLFPTDNWQKAGKPEDANGLPSYLVRQGADGGMEINKGSVFRLPIPQELGVLFKVLPERILNAFAGSSPETLKSLTETIGGLVTPAFLPDIAKAPMEHFTNRSFFTGSNIVPYGAEKLLPQYQYTDYTSETAKQIGKIISYIPGVRDFGPGDAKLASPPVIENYIQAWSGTLGKYALQLTDKALTATGVAKDLKPEWTLSDIPFVKAFVARYPTSNAQSLQDFRDLYAQHSKIMATIQTLGKQGEVSEMQNVYSRYQDQAYKIQGTQDALTSLNHEIQMVYLNPEMTKTDKRQLIDQMYYGMIESAHTGVKLFNEIDSGMKK